MLAKSGRSEATTSYPRFRRSRAVLPRSKSSASSQIFSSSLRGSWRHGRTLGAIHPALSMPCLLAVLITGHLRHGMKMKRQRAESCLRPLRRLTHRGYEKGQRKIIGLGVDPLDSCRRYGYGPNLGLEAARSRITSSFHRSSMSGLLRLSSASLFSAFSLLCCRAADL